VNNHDTFRPMLSASGNYSGWDNGHELGGHIDPFDPPRHSTTQEWEMADDLGDSHPNSLRQGGALPANSAAMRTVGRFFPAAGQTVTIDTHPQASTNRCELLVLGNSGVQITNIIGYGNLTLNYLPPASEYETIKIHYTEATNVSQKVWVKVHYTAPTSLKPVAPAFANLNWLANRQFQFTLDVGIGVRYFIQASSDLINWSAITTNAAPFDFADNAPGNSPIRFYRGVYFP